MIRPNITWPKRVRGWRHHSPGSPIPQIWVPTMRGEGAPRDRKQGEHKRDGGDHKQSETMKVKAFPQIFIQVHSWGLPIILVNIFISQSLFPINLPQYIFWWGHPSFNQIIVSDDISEIQKRGKGRGQCRYKSLAVLQSFAVCSLFSRSRCHKSIKLLLGFQIRCDLSPMHPEHQIQVLFHYRCLCRLLRDTYGMRIALSNIYTSRVRGPPYLCQRCALG